MKPTLIVTVPEKCVLSDREIRATLRKSTPNVSIAVVRDPECEKLSIRVGKRVSE